MILSKDMYVPVLSWRMGEYQALKFLKTQDKNKIMPLICIPQVEFDFDTRKDKKTVDEHVRPFVNRYEEKWGTRPAWVALHNKIAAGRMDDESHVFDYVLGGLHLNGAHAVPVLALESDADTVAAVAKSIDRDRQGVGIRIRLEKLMFGNSEDSVVKLVERLSLRLKEVDLIIDLRAPNFEPYQQFAKALIAILRSYRYLSACRNFVVVSSAIPKSYGQLAKGIDEIPRHDWLFYKTLHATLPQGMRWPVYGDYTTVNPEFSLNNLDMRMIKPAGKIIYTTPTIWATSKGRAFRDHPKDMIDNCMTIVSDPKFQFQGADFSDGDHYIAQCAAGEKGTSNLTFWKRVMINHHITAVLNDLANYHASS